MSNDLPAAAIPEDHFSNAITAVICATIPRPMAASIEPTQATMELKSGNVAAVLAPLARLGYRPIHITPEQNGQRIHFVRTGETPLQHYSLLVTGAHCPSPGSRAPVCLAVLGPDGVGKSTISGAIINTFTPPFTAHVVAHWRPGILTRIGPARPLHQPHCRPLRNPLASVLYVGTVFLDCWVGHLHRRLSGGGSGELYVFDRYFHDILVDARRYRYSGPEWLPRTLARLVPPRDLLTIILDADENVIYGRKRELPLEEISRQRQQYQRLAREIPGAIVIRTDTSMDAAVAQACNAVAFHLHRRLDGSTHPGPTTHKEDPDARNDS